MSCLTPKHLILSAIHSGLFLKGLGQRSTAQKGISVALGWAPHLPATAREHRRAPRGRALRNLRAETCRAAHELATRPLDGPEMSAGDATPTHSCLVLCHAGSSPRAPFCPPAPFLALSHSCSSAAPLPVWSRGLWVKWGEGELLESAFRFCRKEVERPGSPAHWQRLSLLSGNMGTQTSLLLASPS